MAELTKACSMAVSLWPSPRSFRENFLKISVATEWQHLSSRWFDNKDIVLARGLVFRGQGGIHQG